LELVLRGREAACDTIVEEKFRRRIESSVKMTGFINKRKGEESWGGKGLS